MKTLLGILLFLGNSFCLAGTESSGGGGDASVAEFLRLGQKAYDAFFNHQLMTLEGKYFDHRPFKEALATVTLVTTKDSLVLKGKNVTAINYPTENKIILSEPGWQQLDVDTKMQLVIHEFLGLKYRSIFDDSNYVYSRILLEATKQFTYELAALALARAGAANDFQMKIIPHLTKVTKIQDPEEPHETEIYEVHIQTEPDCSSHRIYEIEVIGGLVVGARIVEVEACSAG